MQIKYDFKAIRKMFFDRKAVTDKVDPATRKVLSKFGAFVRTSAKHSIRTKKGTSKPGRPPFGHNGLLKRLIFFGYDKEKRSVVIGPVIAPKKSGKAPSNLEYGGIVEFVTGEKTEIEPRPFMGPAFELNKVKLPDIWRDAIK